MQPRRPTSMLVLAIFHFIFGGFGLLCGICGGVSQGTGLGSQFSATPPGAETPQQKDMRELQARLKQRIEQEAPLQNVFIYVNLTLGLVLSVLLLIGGFGLVQMQPWGWWASVAYGVLALVVATYTLLFNVFYNIPVSQRIAQEELASHPSLQPIAWAFQIATPISIAIPILSMIYPVIVLILMSRPSIRAAFRGEGVGPEGEADPYDRGGDRPPPGYGDAPPGYGGEPDDRFGSAPR